MEVSFLIVGASIVACSFFLLHLMSERFRARMVVRSKNFERIAKEVYIESWKEAKREYIDRTHRPVTTASCDEIAAAASEKFNSLLDEYYDGI